MTFLPAAAPGAADAIDGFPTVDALRADLQELCRAHPDRATASVIGHSREGAPIDVITIGDGPAQVVVAAGVHPNEPIGFRTVQRLARLLLTEPEHSRGATWHLVPCADPDGTRLNEGWFAPPLRRADYYRGFYRPAPSEQVEWSFPFAYRGARFDAPIPETLALMGLFDRVRPDVFVGLHNGEFGGVYFYTNDADPALARELSAIPAAFGLPLDVGEPEMDGLTPLADAVFRAPLTRELIDHRLASGLGLDARAGGAGTADYLERYGTTTMIAELPYWIHPDAADTTATDLAYREVLRTKADHLDELHALLTGTLDAVRPLLAIDSPFLRASEAFAPGMGAVAVAERRRSAAAAADRPATVAEVFGNTEVVRTFRLRFAGILRRALDAEVHAGTAAADIRRARDALAAQWERWLAEDPHADLPPVPVEALVGVQLAALFATVRRRLA